MGQQLNCHIVQDLLPNYIEGLTSEGTNEAIQEHLASCSDCRQVLDSMMTETEGFQAAPQKQINFLKKIKRRQWIVAGISVCIAVSILLAAFYFFGTRKFPIASSDVTISDVYQMKDGSIHFRITAHVNGYLSNVGSLVDTNREVHRIYERRRFFSEQDKKPEKLPEYWSTLDSPDPTQEKTIIYYQGKDDSDRLVIWEKGMNIPKATAEQEAAYERTNPKPDF
ncbi:Putative zinc-finger [Paenibacillus algorifonticola]|uniref:Anti-sigma-W factor RsiW n=1 Tax=Paenibacillus algorifonticola TaxID=684063 RepID=A0A1I2FRR4_9BACL|nr:zf-HC2 domain-containing protein [Paenibacillus algorifonticola]SFF08094.1 Putative zinc-finger [Paenibacillus algorifonticola]